MAVQAPSKFSKGDELSLGLSNINMKFEKAINKLKARIDSGDTFVHKGLTKLGVSEGAIKDVHDTMKLMDNMLNMFIGYQSRSPEQFTLFDQIEKDIKNPDNTIVFSVDGQGNDKLSVHAAQETPLVEITRVQNKNKLPSYKISKSGWDRRIDREFAEGLYLTIKKEFIQRLTTTNKNVKKLTKTEQIDISNQAFTR